MTTRSQHVWSTLRHSLWFVPALLAASGVLLSAVVAQLDERFEWSAEYVPLLYDGTAEGAEATLTAIAGSMVTVTGVVFSITVVALSLASTQLGPRLLRNFMRDTSNQVVLGVFLATFVFCLLGLQTVDREAVDGDGVPNLTVTVGSALALVSLAAFIHFIHHIANAMQADTVIANVSRQLWHATDTMYPSMMGEGDPDPPRRPLPEEPARALRAGDSGYIQALDEDRLLALAVKHDLVVCLDVRPGDFVHANDRLLRAWPAARAQEALVEGMENLFILGRRRTAEQDVEFLIDQLVETACRSLSPGINDPFTAMACIDRMGNALARLARRRFPSPYRLDEAGNLRVIARRISYPELVDAAFDQVRQYGSASVSVTLRLLESIAAIAEHADLEAEDRREALRRQARRIHRMSHGKGHDPDDQRAIDERYARAMALLAGASG